MGLYGYRRSGFPAKGVGINIINPADYGIVTQGYTIFATDSTIQNRPDVTLKFLRATLRGVDYTMKHPEEARDILVKREPSLDPGSSLKRLKAYLSVTSDTLRYPPGYMDQSMIQDTYDRLNQEHALQSQFPIQDSYTHIFFLIRSTLSSGPVYPLHSVKAKMPNITVQGIGKTFGSSQRGVRALNNVSFSVRSGEFVCLVGPSGCGKTTLLRIVGDLAPTDEGVVRVGEASPAVARSAGVFSWVFQTPVLLPWRDLIRNVTLPTEILPTRKARDVKALLQLVGLTGFETIGRRTFRRNVQCPAPPGH